MTTLTKSQILAQWGFKKPYIESFESADIPDQFLDEIDENVLSSMEALGWLFVHLETPFPILNHSTLQLAAETKVFDNSIENAISKAVFKLYRPNTEIDDTEPYIMVEVNLNVDIVPSTKYIRLNSANLAQIHACTYCDDIGEIIAHDFDSFVDEFISAMDLQIAKNFIAKVITDRITQQPGILEVFSS